jgi:hypothetical protein
MRHQPAQTPPRRGYPVDKLAVRHQATIYIAMINEWL